MMYNEDNIFLTLDIRHKLLRKSQFTAPPDYQGGVISRIRELFNRKKFCDVTLIAGKDDSRVEAHRLVLSVGCPYFENFFGDSHPENENLREVTLDNLDGSSLEKIVTYIYTATITVSTLDAEDLILAAKFLQLDALISMCSSFVSEYLLISNCKNIKRFAEHYGFEQLKQFAIKYVYRHFFDFRQTPDFYQLTYDQLVEYLSSDELSLPSEEDVFETIMLWVRHKKANREHFIDKLLNYVRFPLLPPNYIVTVVEPVCKTAEADLLMYKAMKWHYMPDLRSTTEIFPIQYEKPRRFMESVYAINGWDRADHNLCVGMFYPGADNWIYKRWPSPQQLRYMFGCTTLNGSLIVAGGSLPNSDVTDSVECMDLRTLEWSKLPPMTTKRHSFGLTSVNGKLYAIGGENDVSSNLVTIDKYDPETAQWLAVSPMKEALGTGFYCTSGSDMICVSKKQIKGCMFDPFNYDHNIYDTNTGQWVEPWVSTKGEMVGTAIWRSKSIDYLVVAIRSGITLYNLSDKTAKPLPRTVVREDLSECKLFGDRLVFYGTDDFCFYELNCGYWKQWPDFDYGNGKYVLISH